MKVRYYGVRGSVATPLIPKLFENKVKNIINTLRDPKYTGMSLKERLDKIPYYIRSTYGGNSLCVLLEVNNNILIFDAGTGIRELGLDLMKTNFAKGTGKAKIFFSHTHWDHIQGLPFFAPLFIKGNSIEMYSGFTDLEERIRNQQSSTYFPVDLDYMQSSKAFFQLQNPLIIDDIKISIIKQNHPGDSFAYRVEYKNKCFVYSTDTEFNFKNYEQIQQAVEFYQNADVLTFDTQYSLLESMDKIDWGHSSVQLGIDIAKDANVKKLVLFHYDPTYSDEKINKIHQIGLSYKEKMYPNSKLEILPSFEGMEIEI